MSTSISFPVERPVTEFEYADIQQAIKNIMADRSFFYGGGDDLGEEIRRFRVDHPIESNLELVED
jgi:hypothetical protein